METQKIARHSPIVTSTRLQTDWVSSVFSEDSAVSGCSSGSWTMSPLCWLPLLPVRTSDPRDSFDGSSLESPSSRGGNCGAAAIKRRRCSVNDSSRRFASSLQRRLNLFSFSFWQKGIIQENKRVPYDTLQVQSTTPLASCERSNCSACKMHQQRSVCWSLFFFFFHCSSIQSIYQRKISKILVHCIMYLEAGNVSLPRDAEVQS